MRVGVIDSSICNLDVISKNIKEHIILTQDHKNNKELQHADYVCNTIIKENSDVNIVLISIIDNQNKSTISLLIKALDILLNKNVDIVNISLGIESTEKSDLVNKLYRLCANFRKRKIPIIASYSNLHINTYPAAFDNVIGIDSTSNNIPSYNLCTIDRCNMNIKFNIDTIEFFIGSKKFQRGNSFITAIISGLCSNYKIKNIEDIFDIVEFSFKECVKNIFYFPKFNLTNSNVLRIYDSNKRSDFSKYNLVDVENEVYIKTFLDSLNINSFNESYDLIVLDLHEIISSSTLKEIFNQSKDIFKSRSIISYTSIPNIHFRLSLQKENIHIKTLTL